MRGVLQFVAETPSAMFPPDPTKIPEYMAQFAKLGLDFGKALTTQGIGMALETISFVEDLLTLLA